MTTDFETDIDIDTIRTIEDCGFAAWPALETVPRHGWLLRCSGGRSRRVNAVSPREPTGFFDGLRIEAERFYAQRDQPCLFRVTPLAPDPVDAALATAGYARIDDSLVMTRSLERLVPDDDPAIRLEGLLDEDWSAASAGASGLAPAEVEIRDAMLARIRPPTCFASMAGQGHGAPGAYGFAVVEHQWVGLFALVTHADARRQGLGRRLVEGLLAWGQERGARNAYLQVAAANAPARALYDRLGFEAAYGYHYRVQG